MVPRRVQYLENESRHPVVTRDAQTDSPDRGPCGGFATTHWSLILQAGDPRAAGSDAALGRLYETYAYPLYAYLRRRGQGPDDARDLVQELFLALLRKNQLATVTPAKGRFRSYLLASANHLLANEWTRAHRQKRGNGETILPWDALSVEDRFRLEPPENQNSATLFDQRWALTLLEVVLGRLRSEFAIAGKLALFEALQIYLSGDPEAPSYGEASRSLGITEGAARVAVHRLRQRYRDLLRAEIAQTVSKPEEIEDELRYLLHVLKS